MTLTKQFGRNGDAGGWGCLPGEGLEKTGIYTLSRNFAERESGKMDTFSHWRKRGSKDDYKMEEITYLYDDQKHPIERVKLWHRERRKNYWNE